MNVALCGYYGKNNFGDDLMQNLLSEKLLLNKSVNNVKVYSDTKTENVDNFLDKSYLDSDIIVIGGGGIVTPDFWLLSEESLNELILKDKKVIFLNVNLTAEFDNPAMTKLLKKLNPKWWVRDNYSVETLKKYGIKSNLIYDISLTLKTNIAQPNIKKVSVFLNHYAFYDLFSNNSYRFINVLNSANIISHHLDWMSDFGWEIELIPSQIDKEIDDRWIAGFIYAKCKNKNYINFIDQYLGCEEIIKRIGSSELVLSSRYHSTLVSCATNTKFIDLHHHHKNINFLKDNKLFDKVGIDLYNFNHNDLISKISYVETNDFSEQLNKINSKAVNSWIKFDNFWKNYKG